MHIPFTSLSLSGDVKAGPWQKFSVHDARFQMRRETFSHVAPCVLRDSFCVNGASRIGRGAHFPTVRPRFRRTVFPVVRVPSKEAGSCTSAWLCRALFQVHIPHAWLFCQAVRGQAHFKIFLRMMRGCRCGAFLFPHLLNPTCFAKLSAQRMRKPKREGHAFPHGALLHDARGARCRGTEFFCGLAGAVRGVRLGTALHGGGQQKAPPGRGSAGGADALGEGKEFFNLFYNTPLFFQWW